MSTAIVGIDIGSYSCYVSVAKKGGIETILNEYSDRCTASCISFSDKTRFIGTSGNLQLVTNPKNTINNFTPLIGKKFYDNNIQIELPYSHYKIFEYDDSIGVEVSYLQETHKFKPEQLIAMLITKLKHLAENDLKLPVKQAVLNVPLFYTDIERRCLVSALNIAGLECLCLINDLSAVALLYHSMRGQSFSNSKIMAFVDVGFSNFQAVIIEFTKEKFQILQTAYDSNLGGREFDRVIYKYLSRYFAEQFSVDVLDSTKAGLRLMTECEKVKKRLSANSAEFVVNIDCLMNDKDVSAKIDRLLFEKLSEKILTRMRSVIETMLQQYEKTNNKGPITLIEIVGGASRIPCVRQVIAETFKMEPQNTLNADEAVSRGCSIQCAIMNTKCMIRRIEFLDCVPFGITLDTFTDVELSNLIKYDAEKKASIRQESVPIAFANYTYPLVNAVELDFDECSIIEIRYTEKNEIPNDNKIIGYIKINHESGTSEKMCKMLLEYSIDKFGIFSVNSLVIKRNSKSPRSVKPSSKSDQFQPVEVQKSDASKKKGKNHKSNPSNYDVYGPIDFHVYYSMSISTNTLDAFRNKENEFIEKDRQETDRLNVKNRLEESIYKFRDILNNLDPLVKSRSEVENLLNNLNRIETWLFNEGENEDKEKFEENLNNLECIAKNINLTTNVNQNEPNILEDINGTLKEAEYILFHATTSIPNLNDEINLSITKLKNAIEMSKMIVKDSSNGNLVPEDTLRLHIAELRHWIDYIKEQVNRNLN